LKADALSAQTSVNATVPIISVPLAMGMAGCLTFALSTFLGERMETTFGIGWAIGLAMASIAAGCATTPKLWHVRLFVTIVFVFLAPTLLIVTGKEELGLGWLAFGSVAYCLAVPAVEWASGTTVGTSIGKARSFRMALSGSAKNRDPFVGASFVGIMMFALPGDRVLMASLAAGYFACLFAFSGACLVEQSMLKRNESSLSRSFSRVGRWPASHCSSFWRCPVEQLRWLVESLQTLLATCQAAAWEQTWQRTESQGAIRT